VLQDLVVLSLPPRPWSFHVSVGLRRRCGRSRKYKFPCLVTRALLLSPPPPPLFFYRKGGFFDPPFSFSGAEKSNACHDTFSLQVLNKWIILFFSNFDGGYIATSIFFVF